MRKLIIFTIPLFFSLTISKTLLVPEEFLNIQQAVIMAQNGDTVSVNFGKPNGQRSVVSNQRIMGKEIIFEVRGEGKEESLRMVREMNNLPNIDGRNQRYPPPGWQGQGWVSRPDASTDQQPCIAMDSLGYPWVVWFGYGSNYSLAYTKWNGIDWDEEKGVVPNPPGFISRSKPSISFDNQNRAWSAWANMYDDNSTDISFSRWRDTCWAPEAQVNLPDSSELDFAPRISYGGGEIWCIWYGGPTDVSPYTVFASRWNGTGWEPDMEVSPPDGFHHWFCSIAIDSTGTPHVVWCEVPHYSIYYSYYDGAHWTHPLLVNDTTQVLASPWADPRISIDQDGNLNVCWTGALVVASHRDIFYSKYDDFQWLPAIKISQDSIFDEWYSDIAVDRPENIWITWDRQGEGPDRFRVYTSHFDGTSWSEEMRLDDDTTSYNETSPDIRLDVNGDPWVVWYGVSYLFPYGDIYYNRYLTAALEESVKPSNPVFTGFGVSSNPSALGFKILYRVSNPTRVSFEIYDENGRKIKTLVHEYQAKGEYVVYWDSRDSYNKQVSTGIYFCRLRIGNIKEVKKIILLK